MAEPITCIQVMTADPRFEMMPEMTGAAAVKVCRRIGTTVCVMKPKICSMIGLTVVLANVTTCPTTPMTD